ncbi:ABC transporter ATP-binding protein [Desulfobacterota bacterium M19]
MPPLTVLTIQDLNRSFGGIQAVSDVSFKVSGGTIKALIGPNGAGKTTLFNLICGNLPPTSGRIIFKDQAIAGQAAHRIARLGLARTFQNIKLYPGLSTLENVMLGRHSRSHTGFMAAMLNLPRTWREEADIAEKSYALLKMLNIADLADKEAMSLAFGQQRAVEMARALAAEPELLLLDEPAAGLNIYETAELAELISKIRDMGITILLVEHDMSLVMQISDEIVVLNFGRKIAEGAPGAIQNNQEVIKIYLGGDD